MPSAGCHCRCSFEAEVGTSKEEGEYGEVGNRVKALESSDH